MTYVAADTDDASDLERHARAQAAHRRKLLDALFNLDQWLNQGDRGFVIRLRQSDLTQLSATDKDRLDHLVWDYRRQLPDALRPKLPPFDPIVRQMEKAGV